MVLLLLYLIFVIGVMAWSYRIHRRERHNLRLFWFGVFCFIGWVGTVWALQGNNSWWWSFILLPLNGGWMLLLPWPIISRYWPFNYINHWVAAIFKHLSSTQVSS